MSNAATLAKQAALSLAAQTRDVDMSDKAFAMALDNTAFYYGIDMASVAAAFDNLTADEFGAAPATADRSTPWA